MAQNDFLKKWNEYVKSHGGSPIDIAFASTNDADPETEDYRDPSVTAKYIFAKDYKPLSDEAIKTDFTTQRIDPDATMDFDPATTTTEPSSASAGNPFAAKAAEPQESERTEAVPEKTEMQKPPIPASAIPSYITNGPAYDSSQLSPETQAFIDGKYGGNLTGSGRAQASIFDDNMREKISMIVQRNMFGNIQRSKDGKSTPQEQLSNYLVSTGDPRLILGNPRFDPFAFAERMLQLRQQYSGSRGLTGANGLVGSNFVGNGVPTSGEQTQQPQRQIKGAPTPENAEAWYDAYVKFKSVGGEVHVRDGQMYFKYPDSTKEYIDIFAAIKDGKGKYFPVNESFNPRVAARYMGWLPGNLHGLAGEIGASIKSGSVPTNSGIGKIRNYADEALSYFKSSKKDSAK